MSANLENSTVATELEKISFHSSLKEGPCQRMVKTIIQLLSFHMLYSKVMLKILQARLQHYVNQELLDVQAVFQRGKGSRDKLPIFVGLWRKQGSSRKSSASLTMLKPLTELITRN